MVKLKLSDINIEDRLFNFFTLLSEEERSLLLGNYTLQSFKKNETIYCEEEVPKHLYCLLNGKVKIYKDGVGGRSQIIRMIKSNGYFGYRAYFAKENYLTAAAAFEQSVICTFPLNVIDKIIHDNSEIAYFFIQALSVDLGISDARTVNLTQKHIRGRLAESLLFLKESYGLEEDNATISIYLSREDLASLSNMTTSNAIRTLSNFANEHLIAIDGRKIKIIDEEHLRKISKIG